MTDAAVQISHVWKRFRLGASHDSLGDLLSSGLARLVGRVRSTKRSTFWALHDLDCTVNRGEAVGIIGPNGAGKSTALKLLSGILRPERGSISVRGRLAALIEVGAGFHGDLTGRENIALSGAILGMTRRDIRKKLDGIVAFAGIGKFLDMPVKRYSSGMYARLGFSIASYVDPDILLVDEVLSVGDAVFRLRCVDRMRELVKGGTTLIFVTHNLDQMQSICGRAVVLDGGRKVFEGPAREAVGHYMSAMSQAYATRPADVAAGNGVQDSAIELQSLNFSTEDADDVVWVRSRESVRAELALRLKKPFRRLVVELNLRAPSGENVLSFNSGRDGKTFEGRVGVQHVTLSLPALRLSGGQYFWNVRVWDADSGTNQLDTPQKFPMLIDDEGRATGSLALDHEWQCSFSHAESEPGENAQNGLRVTADAGECCEDMLLR